MASHLFTLGQRIGTKNIHCARSSVSFYSINKLLTATSHLGVQKKDSNKKIASTEQLEDFMKSAIDPIQVLSALPSTLSEYKQLSIETVVYALKTITTLQKANSKSIQPNFILSHPNFELICRRLKICSPMFTVNELIESFKLLCLLGVPKNSELSLHLLQLVRHEINYLDVSQIIFLCFVLERSESCSELENSVRTALPMVFDQQIPEQITSNQSAEELVKILNFMSAHQMSAYIKDTNIKRICRILADKKDDIDITNAINITHSLCLINRFEVGNSIRLLNICIRHIIFNVNEVNITDLMPTIQRLVSTIVANQYLSFQYTIHGLLKRSAERISQQNLGLKLAAELQTACNRINFRNTVLLEYIGDQIVSNPSCRCTMGLQELRTIVRAFAYNGCLPESVDLRNWKNQIVPNIIMNENLANVPPSSRVWLKFVFQLMILDHYGGDLINRVLSREYLDKHFSTNNNERSLLLDFYHALAVFQTAKTRPEIDLSSVHESVLEEILSRYTAQVGDSKIQQALINQIGSDFVVTNARTKNYHLLSTVLKMNTKTMCLKQFPASLQRDSKGFILLDDIPCAADEKLICVDIIKKYNLFSNASRRHYRYIHDNSILGIFRLRNQQLMDLGVTVCNMNQAYYERLSEQGRINYLHEVIFGHYNV